MLHALGGILLRAVPTFLLVIVLHFYLKSIFFKPLEKVLHQRYEATEGARKLAEQSLQQAAAKTASYETQLRTAKVRIEVRNPGFLKLGMFVMATFASKKTESHPVVPAEAVLHLHDRDWVFVPSGGNHFKRTEVRSGQIISGSRQVILSGIEPGQQVVKNALLLETAGNQ